MKIAILDTVPEKFWHHDGGITDGEKFEEMLAPGMAQSDFRIFYCARQEFPSSLQEFDGYLITGSPCSVNDDSDWMQTLTQFVHQCDQRKKPLAGFCFGHQFIARALGGCVAGNENGWNIGLFDVEIEPEQTWMQPFRPVSRLYHFNRERVLSLPSVARPFARSSSYPDCGYAIGEHIIAIQGHPEQPRCAMHNFLDHAAEQVGPAVVTSARASIDSADPDQALWAGWVANFFLSH